MNNVNSSAKGSRRAIRRAVQAALATTVFATALPVGATLQDHGPGDATINFPLWYRDNAGLALSLCKNVPNANTGALPAGTFCFPTPTDTAFFAGNIGGEAFYQDLNVNVTNAAIDLRYIAALEAAYGNAAGDPIKGQEIVFSRIRFVMEVLSPACVGQYTIKHPFGTYTNTVNTVGPRALFDTIDVPLGALGDFEGALKGDVGPFLQWDDGAGNPLNTTALRAANGLTFNGLEFVGDPTILHTFTGSPVTNDADGTKQNYVEVIAPESCNLTGLGGPGSNVSRVSLGLLLGQVWTAPIPTPTNITAANFSRNNANGNAVDVWAKSATNQNIVLTGTGMPSVKMKEDSTKPGFYHSHVEYTGAVPPAVVATNTTSNPPIQSEAGLRDLVDITGLQYDSSTRTVCVTAHSLDELGDGLTPAPQGLRIDSIDALKGGPLKSDPPCPNNFGPKPDPRDVSYFEVLDAGAMVPPTLEVVSDRGGRHSEDVSQILPGLNDKQGGPTAGDDVIADADAPGNFAPKTLDLTGGDSTTTATLIIIKQPTHGTATGSPNGGTAVFTPTGGDGPDSFEYVLQDATGVSNIATVSFNVQKVAPPPTLNRDAFALKQNGTVAQSLNVNIFANDVDNGNPITPATLEVATTPNPANWTPVTAAGVNVGTIANVTLNANGTVKFRGLTSAAGNYSFYYRAANANGVAQTPGRIDVVLESGAESNSITRMRFTASRGSWDIRPQTNWLAVPAGNNPAGFGGMTPTQTCWLTAIGGNSALPGLPRLIGGGDVPQAAGPTLIQPAVAGPGWPTAGQTFTVQCATSNATAAYPTNANTNVAGVATLSGTAQ